MNPNILNAETRKAKCGKPQLSALVQTALALLVLVTCFGNAFGADIDEKTATTVADFWFASELNAENSRIEAAERAARLEQMQQRTVLYMISGKEVVDKRPDDASVLAYIIVYQPTGYVIVSGENRIEPIIAFDTASAFQWEGEAAGFAREFLGTTMTNRWKAIDAKDAEDAEDQPHPNWTLLLNTAQTKSVVKGTYYVLYSTPIWAQGTYYNATVLANNGNTAGIPTGCTATAMAMQMRFHEWPLTGSGSRSYNDTWGDVKYSHSVNFGAQSYNWSQMPMTQLTAHNAHVANLMYHCGVAVSMNYEVGGSGAWPSADNMNTHFRYHGTTQLTSGHEAPMRNSIKAGLPVVISSSDHTVLACGYRDTVAPYFYFNAGWNGGSNGWYNYDDVCGTGALQRSYPYSSPNNYIYVDTAWGGTQSGTFSNPYKTVGQGNTAVPWYGRIFIKGGTYTGAGNVPVTFTKPMLITSYEGSALIR